MCESNRCFCFCCFWFDLSLNLSLETSCLLPLAFFLVLPSSPKMPQSRTPNDPSNGYRSRFIYCSIGAVLLCVGVIFLVSGIVVYILSTTGGTTYINDFFYHQPERTLNHTPILVAIILCSFGGTLIAIAIVFSFLACFTDGNIHNMGEEIKDANPTPPKRMEKSNMNETQVTSPLLKPDSVTVPMNEPTAKYYFHNNNNGSPTPTPTTQGDINTVGLPAVVTPTRKVPPNGFSYLVHPSEIHSYHNRLTPVRVQHKTIPTASNKESEI